MNKPCLLLFALCCFGFVAQAQNRIDPQRENRPSVQHALLFHAGGAALGVGPGYELLLSSRRGLTIAPGLSLPLLHSTWHNYYSPISLSPSVNVMWGRRHWKMELSTEYNYFIEWARNQGGTFSAYTIHSLAMMPGLRRQTAGGGLVLRANLGAKLVGISVQPELLPAATVSIGYAFRNKSASLSGIPPKPKWQWGNRIANSNADSSGQKTFQIQFAPMAAIGLNRQLQHQRKFPSPYEFPEYTFQFQTRWATQLGGVADLGNAGAIAGLRLGLAVGLQRVRLDWHSKVRFQNQNGAYYDDHRDTHIDDFQLTLGLSACLRLRTLTPQPWIFQIGMLGGKNRTLARDSWQTSPNSTVQKENQGTLRFGLGPTVSISKQWSWGTWRIEPFWETHCSLRRIYLEPNLYQCRTSAGVLFWL
jgi:hypothetical protein